MHSTVPNLQLWLSCITAKDKYGGMLYSSQTCVESCTSCVCGQLSMIACVWCVIGVRRQHFFACSRQYSLPGAVDVGILCPVPYADMEPVVTVALCYTTMTVQFQSHGML